MASKEGDWPGIPADEPVCKILVSAINVGFLSILFISPICPGGVHPLLEAKSLGRLYGDNLAEPLQLATVEGGRVAYHNATIVKPIHVLLLEVHYVLQAKRLNLLEKETVGVVVYAQTLGSEELVEIARIGSPLRPELCDETLLADVEGGLALRHVRIQFTKGIYALLHLVVLALDIAHDVATLFFGARHDIQ